MTAPRRGQSFRDASYDTIEARLEAEYHLPAGGIAAIRTRGERSNADQVSSAGARSVYQIIPATRDRFLRRYGVDAYASPENAARVAALHLRDSMRRNGGDWAGAVAEYHGGGDARNHGQVNRAYVARVTGQPAPAEAGGAHRYSRPSHGTDVPTMDLKDIPVDDLIHSTPDELFADGRTRLRPEPHAPRPTERQRVTSILTGGRGLAVAAPVDTTPVRAERTGELAANAAHQAEQSVTLAEQARAAFETQIIPSMVHALGQQHGEFDPDFVAAYRGNYAQFERMAQSDAEVDQLRDATNAEHYGQIVGNILTDRENNRMLDAGGHGTATRLASGIVDPAGWVAGFGVGKAFQAAGVGARVLASQGRTAAAVLSSAGEGLIGNVVIEAGLDASGDYVAPEDYAMSALTGLAIGTATSPFIIRGVHNERVVAEIEQGVAAQRENLRGHEEAARTRLGADATPEDVSNEMRSTMRAENVAALRFVLSDIPEADRLLSELTTLTENKGVLADVTERHGLAGVADTTERGMIAEMTARAEGIVARNPLDATKYGTILERLGQESTAMRLLKSESPVARAMGITLLENPGGQGGRRRTASLVQATRERVYNESFAGYGRLSEQFRTRQGISALDDALRGTSRNEFDSRVFYEVEGRSGASHVPDADPIVIRGADLFEGSMDLMRREQQHVGTVGSDALKDNSVGYVPHRADPRAMLALTATQRKRVVATLSGQFQSFSGFDKKFSDYLATAYIERPRKAGNGSYAVPFNLHSTEGAEIIRDILREAGKHTDDEITKVVSKFVRGGAAHTKTRLKMDLNADIGDGKKLGDLFIKNMSTLHRSYSRRVSGEVALAQFGIMGKKGLQVARSAMEATGATGPELGAFDQVAAEFLNTPFGGHNHRWMDNARIATSAIRLGNMGFTQFAEFGNAIPVLGIQRTLAGVASLPRMVADLKAISKGGTRLNPVLQSLDQMNGTIGLEEFHLTRLHDVPENQMELYNGESLGVFSRSLRSTGNAVRIMSGHRAVMAGQVRGLSEMIVRKAVHFAKTGANDTALRDMGFSDTLVAAIRKDLPNIAAFDGNGELTSLDLFAGKILSPAHIAEIATAVERGSSQIIQRTYIGETGAWAHNGFLKLLFQFRTFSLTSVEKQWGRNVYNHGAQRAVLMLGVAAAFAVPIHFARMQTKMLGLSPAERQKYWDENSNPYAVARATMNYASASGLLGDVLDVGGSLAADLPGGIGDYVSGDLNVRGGRGDKVIGGTVAPAAGLVNDLSSGIHGAAGGDFHKLLRTLPGANLPYVTPFINALEAEDGPT